MDVDKLSKTPNEELEDPTVSQTEKDDMIDWWAGTVVLTFFPTLLSAIMSLFRYGIVDVKRLIGDGELVLCSFLIITPSIMNCYQADPIRSGRYEKLFFYILLFASFTQLAAYVCIKTNPDDQEPIVYIASSICVISSIMIAWQSEKTLKGRRK